MNEELGTQRNKPGPKPGSKRGRSGAGMSQADAQANPGVAGGDRESNAHGINRYNRAKPGGHAQSLTIPPGLVDRLKSEGLHPHFALDNNKGRIDQLKNRGYEFYKDEQGNNIYRQSGPFKQYLMVLPKEWHEDDKRLKRQLAAGNVQKEAALTDGQYIPDGANEVVNQQSQTFKQE